MRHRRIISKYQQLHARDVSKAQASFVGADDPKNVWSVDIVAFCNIAGIVFLPNLL